MKDYCIRFLFGSFAIGIMYGIAYIFRVQWLFGNTGTNRVIIPVGLVVGWGGWYLYKKGKN